jgi:hypothetical protein
MRSERVLIHTMHLPGGRPWEWHEDADVLVLSSALTTPQQRVRAVLESGIAVPSGARSAAYAQYHPACLQHEGLPPACPQ